jgi:hypothetical protein
MPLEGHNARQEDRSQREDRLVHQYFIALYTHAICSWLGHRSSHYPPRRASPIRKAIPSPPSIAQRYALSASVVQSIVSQLPKFKNAMRDAVLTVAIIPNLPH